MASQAVTARQESLPQTKAAQRLGRLGAPTIQIAYRIAGIEIRKAFTDSLKRFTAYVDQTGKASSGGKGIYIQLSRRINTTFGLTRAMAEKIQAGGSASRRDLCEYMEVLTLQMLEVELTSRVEEGMAARLSRLDIKQNLYDCIEYYGHLYGDRFTRWRESA